MAKVARSTACTWTVLPGFRSDVARARAQIMDRAIGRLTGAVSEVAAGMIELAKAAESEATKLAAQKAVIATLIEVGDHTEIRAKLAQIDAQLEELGRERSKQGGSRQFP
jgi:hypothetical protein